MSTYILPRKIQRFEIFRPGMPLKTWLDKQSDKPDILLNGSLYQSSGKPIGTIIEDGKMVNNAGGGFGFGTTDGFSVGFGGPWAKAWRDYVTGYYGIVQQGKAVSKPWADGYVFDQKRSRIAFGQLKDGRYAVFTANGVNIEQLAAQGVQAGFESLCNLDGGGSRALYWLGSWAHTSTRAPYNAIAIWLEPEPKEEKPMSKTPKIHKNIGSALHNTTKRPGKIEWIAIHYVGALGDAKANINHYNKLSTTNASADFFVGHSGDIWQYNPDPVKRYCWAVGGSKYNNGGGLLYGKATNKNTIHIEMCVKLKGTHKTPPAANHPDWYITEETLAATIELTRYLMDLHDIPVSKVIRHFDVNGKPCPGVIGWNPLTGSEASWRYFLAAISQPGQAVATQTKPATVQTLQVAQRKSAAFNKAYKTTADLNMRAGAGTDFPVLTTLPQGATFRCYGFYNVVGSTVWLFGVAEGKKGYCSKAYLK